MSAREMRLIVPVLRLKLHATQIIEETEDVWEVKKTLDLPVIWVYALESMIQDEGDKHTK